MDKDYETSKQDEECTLTSPLGSISACIRSIISEHIWKDIPCSEEHRELVTEIKASVERFTQFASEHPELDFLVIPIGCGMGCWPPTHIAPLFMKASELNNVWLPEEFWAVINEPGKFSKLNFPFPKYSRR